MASCIFGVVALLLASLLILPEVRSLVSGLFTGLIDSIYLSGSSATPSLDYSLADRYRDKGRTEAAIREHLKITHYYPQELTAYLEAIKLSFACGEETVAAKVYRTGRRRLRSPEARATLLDIYGRHLAQPTGEPPPSDG